MPDKAESCSRNLANVSTELVRGLWLDLLEGIDEILAVTRLRLPKELRRYRSPVPTSSRTQWARVASLPEREAMALSLDGDALDRGGHAGSG